MAKKQGAKPNPETAEDALTARALGAWQWARENTQMVIVAGVVLAVAVGAGIYYYDYQQNLQMQAAQELERIHQTMAAAQPQTARTELESFLSRFGDTSYGTEARLLLAELHLRQNQPAEAVTALEPAAENIGDPLSVQAAFLLGASYEEAGRPGDAESLYLRIAEEADLGFQTRQALSDAARIRAQQGNYAGAADLYRRILDDLQAVEEPPATAESDRRTFQLRLAEMEAAAEGEGS